jgi:DNA polymerase elongation subunit (family B)
MSNEITFQIIDWLIKDINIDVGQKEYPYDKFKNNILDEENFDEDSIFENYFIKIFGRTIQGEPISLNIYDYTPYFYIKTDEKWNREKNKTFCNLLEEYIESKINWKNKNYNQLFKCKLVKLKDIWGFQNNKTFYYIQLIFLSHRAMKQSIKILSEPLTLAGICTKKKFKLYENNIEPYLRFIHKKNIEPSGWIKVKNCHTTNHYKTKIGKTYFTKWNNVLSYECNQIAPFIISSFDIECNSFDGSFPKAINNYDKLIYDIIEYYEKLSRVQIKKINEKEKKIYYTENEKKEFLIHFIFDYFKNNKLNFKNKIINLEQIHETILYTIDDIVVSLQGKLNYSDEQIQNTLLNSTYNFTNNKTIINNNNIKKDNKEIINQLQKKFNYMMKHSELPELEGDEIIQIGITTHRYGEKNIYDKTILSIGGCEDINDVNIVHCKNEKELIIKFVKIINKLNPDVITGYNIFGFDYQYIYKRALELNIQKELCKMGKIDNYCDIYDNCFIGDYKNPEKISNICRQHYINKTLSSSALGDNFLKYIHMEGRVNVDMMKEIQKGHNLDTYKLDFVSSHFISGKIINQTFNNTINELNIQLDNVAGLQPNMFINLSNKDINKKFKINFVDYNSNIIKINNDNNEIIWNKWGLAKDDVTPQEIFECMKGSDADRARVARYCIQDCALCNYLVIKLEIIANNIGMSNVCSIPFSYIFLRGQGVKIFSLVAKQCKEDNFVIPFQDKKWKCEKCYFNNSSFDEFCQKKSYGKLSCLAPKPENEGYEGAIVLVPKPGIYVDFPISVLDYSSLYPSSMISENISHDTIILDDKYDNLPGYEYVDITFDLYKGKGDDKKKIGEQTCRYVQFKNGEKGLLPRILQKLLKARKSTRKKITWKTITLSNGDIIKGNIIHKDDNITKIKVEDKEIKEINNNLIESCIDTHNEFQKAVLDGLQLAYKITANSLYGQVGATTSPIFMKELAASTTATGRNLILSAKKFAEEKYNCEVIYGDSVPFDEPVIIKNDKGFIDIKTLSQIFNENEPKQYESFKDPDFFFKLRNTMVKVLIDGYDTEEEFVNNTLNIQKYYRSLITKNRKLAKVNHKWIWYNEDDTKEDKLKLINDICNLFKKDTINRSNKQQVKCNYEIWTDNGWQKILRVIRHKTNKKIYRVSSGLGIVDVTEDHSLCNSDKIPIKPKELEINSTKLLHYQFNDFEKLCEPVIIPEYPSLFYGINIKQKFTKYDNTKKYNCQVCFESYDGDMFYWNKNKKTDEFVHGYRCKLCVKKKHCELKNIEFNGKLNRKIQDIKMKEYELSENEAWVWGFFLGDGSCGEYKCPSGLKYSWALNNQSLDRLNRAKDILNNIEDMEFKILDTMDSSNVYKLVPKGSLRYMVHKYRKFMYDEIKNKKVPMIILNASYSIRKAFFDGYYEADGTKGNEGKFIENEKEEKEKGNWDLKYKKIDFTTKGKITAQGLYILATSLGFNLSVRRWIKKDRIYSLNSYNEKSTYSKDRNIVKYVEETINHEMDDGFVYDIETTTGRFAVGVGSIVALQTDSIFIKLPKLKDYSHYGHPTEKQNILQYNVTVGEQLSEDFQKLLKPPHCLEWEKMFYPFIIFSKKRYVGNLYEHNVNKFKQKSMGIVLKRRDNANIVKIIYGGIINILLNENEDNINKSLNFLHKSLNKLMNGYFPIEELIITKTLKAHYKNPLQIAHKVLADRMFKRDPGSAPQINDRVPYVYIDIDEKKIKNESEDGRILQGDKIEDPTYIKENDDIEPDYGFYITNQLMKPCLQLYSLVLEELKGFKYNKNYYENKEKNLMKELNNKKKVEDKIKMLKEKDVEEIIFKKYLNKIQNKKNKNNTLDKFGFIKNN